MQFLDVIQETGTYVAPTGHHHGRHGWVNFDCPFCGTGTKKAHMGYNLAGRYLNCWRCGRHKIVETLVALGLGEREAFKVFKGLDIDRSYIKPERTGLKLPKAGELKPKHRRYLKGRGFDPDEVVRLWDVRGIGLHAKLAWRLLIPIHHNGDVVSWTTRNTGKAGLRYLSASAEEESMNHKSLLYGEDYARHGVIVHEGPLDVWTTGPGAVGTCGVGFSTEQVLRLSKYPVRAVCFDNGHEAQQRARQLCDLLEVYPGQTFNVQLETGDDPNEADPDEIEELRREFL